MTAVGNRAGGQRLSRRGVRKIVDSHLRRVDLHGTRMPTGFDETVLTRKPLSVGAWYRPRAAVTRDYASLDNGPARLRLERTVVDRCSSTVTFAGADRGRRDES
jgi:hypothetical protein